MRLLQSSHSDERSDSDEHARGSLFSQIRSTTSSSNTSYAKGISSHSSVKSPRHDGKHSMMGNAMGDTQTNEHDTMSFLAEAPKSGPGGEDASDNIEVFLNSEAAFQSSGIPSFASASGMLSCTSPSFGVRSYLPTHHESHALEQSMFLGDRPASMPSVERSHFDKEGHEPGIIIDTNGIAHTLSIAEEAQRDISLQQAVMAKMKTGSVGSISNAVPAQSPTHTSPHENPYSEHQSIPSRLQSTWLSRSKAATLKWKSRSEPSPHPSPRFPKLVGLFRKRRTPDQENPLEKPSTITQ
ncbi:hypothetical protein BDV28DRAFT_127771 [Aspergillus coremiiformis]|uniref:Uncharacterized protein n=1 Tax=Aspergillus coremiiformis TaxID=138285 RepID=A0A5N6ZES6_9EURO|nr:hypothetical protein BDV28DRAFT_127771 [Aspergillus coremiiformis]